MWVIIIILVILVLNGLRITDHFTTDQDKLDNPFTDNAYQLNYSGSQRNLQDLQEPSNKIDKTDPKRQKYLQFLGRLNDRFKQAMPTTGPFRGSCDDRINQSVQKRVLGDTFSELQTSTDPTKPRYKVETSQTDPSRWYDCVGISANVCETTNPYFYLSDSKTFPPPWTVATYKDVDYPKSTNLGCFNRSMDCCRHSLSSTNPILDKSTTSP